MKLQELLAGVAVQSRTAAPELEIGEVRYDSRAVEKGDLFVAIRGYATDGHRYIEKALAQGAAAIVCEEAPAGAPAVVVENSRRALAEIAANRFGHPADSMVMLGVTGTNGKTTTTYLIKHILEQAGHTVGLIGTNQNLIGSEAIETERTTPESYELQALFARMRDAGCTHVIMEVSSHSLVLDRVHGIRFAVGTFTNLTQDHLDFHKTMEEYRRAKARLFAVSDRGVINLDDPAADAMLADALCPCLTFSCEKDAADLTARNIGLHADGVSFLANTRGELARVRLAIPGHFSVENALAALGIALQLDMPLADAAKALATATGVKGRVEVVPTDTDYTVLIDYAHSPDGVENVLRAVRGFAKGRVVALFGCGGDRDRTKRPKMGAIAAALSDFCIVTSDNPRTEEPQAIIDDILEGMKDTKTPTRVIVDRPEAIRWALAHARKEDIIVLMGKGHETYQEVNHVKHHMDEREIVADYFADRK
ncbi:UDP-N-acetylmuramoyl-L-alanyl-D-glutamate--2,6-diaminopimelate ligase [Intestinibacillus sp. NTUH-41-i26]|uniref:UDP-N-acetylmuramoyl-L-alanyl-D-glutamate--2, 6-diaminopimelate ligase n=1 Tax=Butyricicoccaceae TaxID=3085642 RepID=UPI000D1FBE2C|nr:MULTISPECIES: UDP-N-acetylmuramoyl-L-alanyl-D-glutamate--2,6-diaminopimelate ligase [Butyricicoccaceae]WOC74460.1 UDP-N-acetylmuramoyl-L-alanyl-D-glutamate--2,6-diaminopimelate ligase [Intestinibacillus sp. NTUH-41-i26]